MKTLVLFAVIEFIKCASYTSVGCWRDSSIRTMPTLEGLDALTGPYQYRHDAIKKCFKAAAKRGYHYFAVQNGGWCGAGVSYQKYGKSTACKANGKGGPWANQVYFINRKIDYTTVGCFKDTSVRAIPTLEGSASTLTGNYLYRANAIKKCYDVAVKKGHHYFAIQNGGWCAAGATFDRYGTSRACKADGKGGPWANQVYFINRKIEYTTVGCYKDTSVRAIPTLEGSASTLTGNYLHRVNAIKKCYDVAVKKGHRYFAIQNGGWCAAGVTFDRYGTSRACKADGKGGPWANEVYEIV